MNENELRIGNWVNRFHGDPTNLPPIPKQFATADFNYLAFIEPIPLTEEWLMKFGFIVNDVSEFGCIMPLPKNHIRFSAPRWITHKFMFGINDDSKKLNVPFLRFDATHTDVYYVHQLQNLYFALTGEELKIKE